MVYTLYPVTHGLTFGQQMLLPSFRFFFQVLACDQRERAFLSVSPRNISIRCSIFVAQQLQLLATLYLSL